ncbi:hypothetical protein DC522_07845 [Microvirga sp. KLBC 81]|uniref:hypothetical protein n=1 Tax=Microvirga sp. KLBC 81 TaxID=1862707 RepID=UPI000D508167|nr:hypothetical protein [Microvirga sp. KLBC 81]PVE25113.1 hypothetical protein DC522_07845 [Microvirga sp. KLBC 81]
MAQNERPQALTMPNYSLQHLCGHSIEENLSETRVDDIRGLVAGVLCPICQTARQSQISSDLSWPLPPLAGTEKQVAWAQRLRAEVLSGILNAKANAKHDELFSLVLNDLHQDVLKQSTAKWWIDNRKMSVMDLVRDYYLEQRQF